MAPAFQYAESGGACFGWSYANGRWGKGGLDSELTFVGVPLDVGAAVLLGGLSFFGGFGRFAEHGHNLAGGSLNSFLARTGSRLGRTAAGADATAKHTAGAWQLGQGAPAWHPYGHHAHAYARVPHHTAGAQGVG